jgi:early secretory antigenic target protein ESAT-6
MTSRIEVNNAAIDDLVVNLSRAIDGIQQHLDTLEQRVVLLRGQWSGEAQTAYDGAQYRWTAAMSELRESLAVHTLAVGQASTILRHTEAEVTGLW